MRIGIFGGSFDPVHNAHLALARWCQLEAALDEVWFTPTAVQPLKRGGPQASDAQRLAMLELAIAEEPAWNICRLEIDRGGLSYTIDTLRTIHRERPDDELFFLMGEDVVREVNQWREPDEILRLAKPLVGRRTDKPIDISSTLVRTRIAAGESIDDLVPNAVARYIDQHRLYR